MGDGKFSQKKIILLYGHEFKLINNSLKNDDRENLSKKKIYIYIYIFNLKFNRRLSLPIKCSFLDIF